MVRAGTVDKLYVVLTAAEGASATLAFTIYKNTSAQTVTCTVGNSATTCNDTAHSFSFAAGDSIAMQTVQSGTGTSQVIQFGIGYHWTEMRRSFAITAAITVLLLALPILAPAQQIKYIWHIRMENHSFDNLFGLFPGANGATTALAGTTVVTLTHCADTTTDFTHDWASCHSGMDLVAGVYKMDGWDNIICPSPSYPCYCQYQSTDIPNAWSYARLMAWRTILFADGRDRVISTIWHSRQAGLRARRSSSLWGAPLTVMGLCS